MKIRHYSMKIQPIQFIVENNLSYIQGNIIKYVCRYNKKNRQQAGQTRDLLKAKHYLDMLIDIVHTGKLGRSIQ